jgi:UDP-N-acetylglucosamine 4,6-dehydratase/5-epimerase
MKSIFTNKNILITGGAGSFGNAIVEKIIKENPNVIRVLDHDEEALFSLEQIFGTTEKVRTLVGDLRDKDRLKRAIEGIDIIIHAAALKHVYSCEYNPFEAVKTNIIGTQNLIDVAIDEGVDQVMLTSTDKAANPSNVMGTSKLMGEKLIVAANYYKGNRKTVFSCVRFGNVMGSSGSVIPLFRKQISCGGPVTITNPDMTRFIISMEQAVELVTKSIELAHGGEVFILKMPAVRIGTLAEAMIEEMSERLKFDSSTIKINNIGIKAGEKMHEDLMTEEEIRRSLETEDFFIILPQLKELFEIKRPNYNQAVKTSGTGFSSKDSKILSKKEINEILRIEMQKDVL